jgi:hypothetical protein
VGPIQRIAEEDLRILQEILGLIVPLVDLGHPPSHLGERLHPTQRPAPGKLDVVAFTPFGWQTPELRGEGHHLDRRQFLKTSALTGAAIAFPGWVIGRSAWADVAPPGCLFGAYVRPRGSETPQSAVANLETKIGRRLGITRHYLNWQDELPGGYAEWSVSQGYAQYISWHALGQDGVGVSWKSIAEGNHDGWIRDQARRMRDWGRKAYFTFHHEPENDPNGNASEFRAAWKRVRNIFDNAGVANLRWVVTLTASTYDGGHGGAQAWLPSEYDMLGVDGYNRFPCLPMKQVHPWRSFWGIFKSAHTISLKLGKPMVVGEYASVEQNACNNADGDPTAKATWLANAGETLQNWTNVKVAMYSHTLADFEGYPEAFWVDSSSASLAAFAAVGKQSHFA